MKRFARIPRTGTRLSILGFFLIYSSFNVLAGVQANPVYTVTGKIASARTGEPLQGATVSVEGTSNTVTADAEGLFSIKVNSKMADLLISFSGFNVQKVPVTESEFIQVALVENAGKLKIRRHQSDHFPGLPCRSELDFYPLCRNTS